MKINFLRVFITFFVVLSIQRLNAQTPSALKNVEASKADDTDEDRGISANHNNFWLGSQIGYKFGGTQEFSDNLIVSGSLLYVQLVKIAK